MKNSVGYKILPAIILGILVVGIIFGSVFINTQEKTLNSIYQKDISSAKKTFYNLQKNDVKMLEASMTDFMTNQKAKDIFIAGQQVYAATGNCSASNKELYDYTKDLYATHKSMGITHFYFETVDSKVFLRVHGQSNCGDNLGRATYIKSKETGTWGTGIELGATAFALRVVSPYYDGTTLIGYLEYGEEIDHFNNIMKEQTGNEYMTIVKKSFIKPESWATVVTNKKLPRNNYNDYPNYLVIESTNHNMVSEGACWNEENIASVSDEGMIFAKFQKDGNTFICGGFSLYDAKNQNVGAIVVVKDVTIQEANSKQLVKNVIIITAVLILLLGATVIVITKNLVVNPIKRLTEAANKINEGAVETPLPEIKSKDEIKDLADSMTSLVGALKFMKEEQKKAEEKSTPKADKKKK